MMTLPIGVGIYPASTESDAYFLAHPRLPVLVMGKSAHGPGDIGSERHGIATSLHKAGCLVIRRHWEPDNQQVDFSRPPESEAYRWYVLILGRLTPDQFKAIYTCAVGPNELYGDVSRYAWLASFEEELCRLLHAVGIAYSWGSIAVGTLDSIYFVTNFAKINAIADSVCYHFYTKKGNRRLEPPAEPWWARRPYLWWQKCLALGMKMPPVFGGESGTFSPWHPSISDDVYISLLSEISGMLAEYRAMGMPVLGHCAFALGAEGDMGNQWNLSPNALRLIQQHNNQPDVDYSWTLPPIKHLEGKVKDFSSPNHDGPRKKTIGIVIHATLSGKNITVQEEYDSTVNYFQNPAPEGDSNKAVSAHAVVGPNRQVHLPVDPDLIAWHCRASNQTHLGLEMAKSRLGDPILPEILDQAAKIVAGWCQKYSIPAQWSKTNGIEEHRNMPTNTDGHQDVGGPFNRDAFLALVQYYMGGGGDMTTEQRKAVLDDLDFLWAYSTSDQIKKDPSESERIIHERIVGMKVTLGLNE